MHRRKFIRLCASGWVMLNAAPMAAMAGSKRTKKIVWIMLRGAMDSLHAVVPTFDRHLMGHREALVTSVRNELLPLQGGFALHPSLKNLHRWYERKQMTPIVAVASPYRLRSHFDAQDLLESGLERTDHESGWLARACSEYQGSAIAISRSIPISLRGKVDSQTWYPSALPDVADDLYHRLEKVYQNDPQLLKRLTEGLKTRASLEMNKANKPNPGFQQLAKNCGELLVKNKTASCAMLELGGWDTHNNQVGRLKRQFALLDDGLGILQNTLAEQWQDTVIVIATEFGRTVAINGTKGTDHGTASALFLAGGAVNGGKVMGAWPGLAKEQLFDQRDLMPTSDVRSWLGAMLQQHWQLSSKQLAYVFPGVTIENTSLIN